ncbi:MAG: hydroxyacid dehydrogenase [Tardiphaga sp.]|nr:hydroxyacid dehydrogenase [Tardiphaga sp.]
MPDKVLIYSRFPKAMMARIGAKFELMDAAGKPPTDKVSADDLKEVRALITAGGQPLGADVMDMLPSLQAIVCYGTGYDGVDLKAMKERGIVLGNSPAANAAAVADLAIMLMLTTTRRLLPADDYLRSGGWANAKPSPLMTPPRGMPGRRIGIYGMGEIGRKIASRAAAFETEVGYANRTNYTDLPYRYFPDLGSLVDWCDVLIVAVRAGPETQHVIDAAMLKRLGKEGYIVNISRGSTIDQAALIAALADGTIAGAGLDVFEKEPHVPDALNAFPNVVVTPHIGGHTTESHVGMQDCVIANLDAFFAGRSLAYGVT